MVDKKLASNPFFFFFQFLTISDCKVNTLTDAGCFVDNDEYDEGL